MPCRPMQLPQSDDEKLQRWVVQQSRAARRNLSPHYIAWGWPVSRETLAALAGLRPYRPPSRG